MSKAFKGYVKNKYSRPAPLKGVRVLEVCTLLFGPAGPAFLAELGAEVIKIELPPAGDVTRSLNPFGWLYKEQGPMFMHINPSKYYMALDLHKEEAQKIFHELAAKSDIIEFNMRPAVVKRWNIDYETISKINPGIIYIEKNGFGQWGQYAEEDRPSNDGAAQALSGYAWTSSFPGHPPLKQSIWICDVFGAMMGEVAILAAAADAGMGRVTLRSRADEERVWVEILNDGPCRMGEFCQGMATPEAAGTDTGIGLSLAVNRSIIAGAL